MKAGTKDMKSLTINEWQELLERYKATPGYRSEAAFRIENTVFTSARHFGGMTYNGERYTYFEPPIPGEKNEDGTQAVAWLMVRDDFLRWASREGRKRAADGAAAAEPGLWEEGAK